MEPYYQDDLVTLYHGRCEDVLPTLPGASIDAVICDPPYGTTACAWDTPIAFDFMWREIKRLVKPRAAVVLFGQEPFSSLLRVSNMDWYKYDWVWKKTRSSDFLNNKNRPREIHEVISVFSDGTTANGSPRRMPYFPQGLVRVGKRWHRPQKYASEHRFARPSHTLDRVIEFTNYPESILEFANPNQGTLHPTQKPLALLEYLVKTYTDPSATVLDFTSGSGTTPRACKNLGRRCIAVEMLEEYCAASVRRLAPRFEEAITVAPADYAGTLFEGL